MTVIGNCSTGDVRLQDGPNVREGRVEVCINNAWGTVCNEQFGVADAIVVCKQMNFSNKGNQKNVYVFTCNVHYGQLGSFEVIVLLNF